MNEPTTPTVPPTAVAKGAAPRIGFVSLGCPKALTDSELILTQLSAEGYQTAKTFEGADLVIVNTCGFIDDAVRESLDTIGEALAENGRVIVTGCLGAKTGEAGGNLVRQMHPSVLAVTGPHATQEVMDAVHANLPKPHDPFLDLVPNVFGTAGIKLTPRHYAYLKISEGCNHRCTFCIIPSMRGDLVSRPVGDVLSEARALFEGGVKELLVISQDTSAYGVDQRYRTGFWDGKPVKTRMLELVQALGEIAEPFGAWVRLHYVYPYPHVDDIIPLMAQGLVLPYLDVDLHYYDLSIEHRDATDGSETGRPRAAAAAVWSLGPWPPILPESLRRNNRQHQPAGIRRAEVQRRAAAVGGGGTVRRVVVQERTAAAQFILEIGEPGAGRLCIFIVAPADAEADAVARRHHDAGRPDLDVELDWGTRHERLDAIEHRVDRHRELGDA